MPINKNEGNKLTFKAKNITEAIEKYCEGESRKEEWRKDCKELVNDGTLFNYFDRKRLEEGVKEYFNDENTSNAFLKVFYNKETPSNYTDLFYYAAYRLAFKQLNYKPVFLSRGIFNSDFY